MELLELDPPQLGVMNSGIYLIDDEGGQILAGPFADEIEALAWIEHTLPKQGTKAPPTP